MEVLILDFMFAELINTEKTHVRNLKVLDKVSKTKLQRMGIKL